MSHSSRRRSLVPHPVVLMLWLIVLAGALTWLVPSGEFKRAGKGLVVPDTYTVIDKPLSLSELFVNPKMLEPAGAKPAAGAAKTAEPASIVALFAAIPAGMVRSAGLIAMIFFIGGMFGVLKATGALTAGLERLLARSRGNIYLLAPMIMLTVSAGSTFLGLISEYLLIIPLMMLLGERLKLKPMHAFAIVAIPAKIGYVASVTNPLPLVIAQPMLGLPVFSGLGLRLIAWVLMLGAGIVFLLWHIRRTGFTASVEGIDHSKLSGRHQLVLALTGLSVVGLCYGASALDWGNGQLGAYYIAVALVLALAGGLRSEVAAESFLEGMKGMVLAGLLVGLAGAVDEILRGAQVLDSVINFLANQTRGHAPGLVANLIMGVEMILGLLIPSISGKAAISMPILGPIAQLSGVSGQTTVLAFLFGSGLTNMCSPTSAMLLAYLGTAKLDYPAWIRFVAPLAGMVLLTAMVLLVVAVATGY